MGLSRTSARMLRPFTISSRSPVRRAKAGPSAISLDGAGGSSGEDTGCAGACCCLVCSVVVGDVASFLLHPARRNIVRHVTAQTLVLHLFKWLVTYFFSSLSMSLAENNRRSFPRAFRPEKQRTELVLAHHPPEFPEGKQRNEDAKHYDGARGQLVEV